MITLPLENLLHYFPKRITDAMILNAFEKKHIQEIRMRSGLPLCVTITGQNYFVAENGKLEHSECEKKTGLIITGHELDSILSNICESSVYAYQNQLIQGFVTVHGGHRVGICGTAVYNKGEISHIKDISSMNFRISRSIIGAADKLIPYIKGEGIINGTLIASPPCGGKTTVLRDLARQLSQRYRIAVVDERGEIGRNGLMCDVLDGYKKAEGMLQAVRGLSPQAILCDEIGLTDEAEAVISCMNAGVPVIATAHGKSIEELYKRPPVRLLLNSGAIFQIILLHGCERPGEIKKVIEVKQYEIDGFINSGYDVRVHRSKDVAEIAYANHRA